MNYNVTTRISWDEMANLLRVFKEREGHCNVPFVHTEDGKNLGIWLEKQRQQKKKGKLDICHETQLKDIGLMWDIHSERWEKNYRRLVKFQQREGHSNVPHAHTEDGMKLGTWLNTQRQQKKKRKLNGSLEKRLDDVEVVWGAHSEQWDKSYFLLVKFQQREGHSIVPKSHIEDGTGLGRWLAKQKQQKEKGKLDGCLEKRLEDVGVVWDAPIRKKEKNYCFHSEQWEKNYCLLVKFQQREGHSIVPISHTEDGLKLGNWLYNQRQQKKKRKLDESSEKRLRDVGVVWEVHSEKWEKNYLRLVKFQQREGHPNVPNKHIEDGINLGDWLNKQRQQKKKRNLDASLETRLEDAGIVWDVRSENWEKNYRLLVKYQQREGHLNIPRNYVEDNTKLGYWLDAQRRQQNKRKLDASLKRRLEDLGVVWDALTEKWEKNYRLLVRFRQREGHWGVPQKHIEGGMKLGEWLDRQRQEKKKGRLNSSRERRLEELGVVWLSTS